jgi:hypothetical protein
MDNTATLEIAEQPPIEQPKVTITRELPTEKRGVKALLRKIMGGKKDPESTLSQIVDFKVEENSADQTTELVKLDEKLDPLESQLTIKERGVLRKLSDNLSVAYYSMALWHKMASHPEYAVGIFAAMIGGLAAANMTPIDAELMAKVAIALGVGSAASSRVSGLKNKLAAGITGAAVGLGISEAKNLVGPSEHGATIDFAVSLLDDIPTVAAIAPKAAELASKVIKSKTGK